MRGQATVVFLIFFTFMASITILTLSLTGDLSRSGRTLHLALLADATAKAGHSFAVRTGSTEVLTGPLIPLTDAYLGRYSVSGYQSGEISVRAKVLDPFGHLKAERLFRKRLLDRIEIYPSDKDFRVVGEMAVYTTGGFTSADAELPVLASYSLSSTPAGIAMIHPETGVFQVLGSPGTGEIRAVCATRSATLECRTGFTINSDDYVQYDSGIVEIAPDCVIDINGSTVEVTGDIRFQGRFSLTGGTALLSGNWQNAGVFRADSSTVVFNGTNRQKIICHRDRFERLIISNTGAGDSGEVRASGTVRVEKEMFVVFGIFDFTRYRASARIGHTVIDPAGILRLGGENLTVRGEFKNRGIFLGGSGDHIFRDSWHNFPGAGYFATSRRTLALGRNSSWIQEGNFNSSGGLVEIAAPGIVTFGGSSFFFDFTCNKPGTILVFPVLPGDLQRFSGMLRIKGSRGNPVSVISSNSGTAANIDLAGTCEVKYASAHDSGNIGNPVHAFDSLDQGNTSGWIFP
ncbi:MAG: hypothetical protein PHQ23_06810 [Candidatus Wallbacteria bacterium]|nr:hypothetical protein [Candidatus Wallbacteria bacterium]